MIPRPRCIARASSLVVLFFIAYFFSTAPARAIQLRWSTGTTDLTVNQNTQAVLVVQADSAEVTLPNSWRLQWTADSSGFGFTPFEPYQACLADTAKVDSILAPQTPADSAANAITAYFCSAGSGSATVAYWLVEVVGGSHGKLKVTALNPADTTQVIESNEATVNGGIDGDYAPSILRASSTHESRQLEVTAVGADLSSATSVSITAPDHLWRIPLTITSRTDSSITAVADVPAVVPEGILEVSGSAEAPGVTTMAADEVAYVDASYPDTILFRDPNPAAYPKDFAFYYNLVPTGNAQHPWKGLFHLIYIRHLKNASGAGQEPCLAHAWSDSLRGWRVDTTAFLPGSGWDGVHVWAPSIVQVGSEYQMFYTGVDASGNQRIGYATTSLLDTTNTTWTRRTSYVYSAGQARSWADSVGLGYSNQQQFRDPFVIEDPDSAGRYLMFVTGEDRKFGSAGRMIIGLARNVNGTLDQWSDLGAYRATDYTHTGITIDESPLVMRDSSGTGAWRIFLANAQYNQTGSNSTFFVTETLGASLSDTTLAVSSNPPRGWPTIDNLYTYLGSDNSLLGWQACEHLQVGSKAHFFAAYQGDGIGITQAHWDPATGNFVIGYPSLADVGDGRGATGVRFYLAGYRPGSDAVRFTVETPTKATLRLVLYDVTGRRLRTLLEGRSVEGRQEISWDCRDSRGSAVRSGVYFAQLTGVGAPRVLRVAVLR